MKEPTQKEIVLKTITDAGPDGVLSKVFLTMFIPRYSARVCELNKELRAQGKEITSVPEDGFCRYTLKGNVGVGAGEQRTRSHEARKSGSPSLHSGVEPTTLPLASAPPASQRPSYMDPDFYEAA